MKKKMVIALACAMAAAAVMGGCGKKENKTGSSAGEEKDVQISAEELLKATDYNVEDYVTLNDYMGMTVELEDKYETTEDAIKEYADQILSQYPAYVKTDKTSVENGDVVNIDYVGKIDGEAFDGGTDEGSHLEIGSGSFIDGFEDGLIGKNVGETIDLNLKFPDDYSNTDVAGKDVVFTVTINSIDQESEMNWDNLTDEYVSSNFSSSGMTTADAFKKQVEYSLESQNEQQKEQDLQNAVLEKLVAECKVTMPEGLLEQRVAQQKENVQKQAEENNQTLEEYTGVTEEEVDETLNTYMEESLIQELILEAIVKDQAVSISTSEFNSFVSSYISYYGMENAEAFYEQYGGEAYVKLSFAENQALTKVAEAVNVTYKESTDENSDSDTSETDTNSTSSDTGSNEDGGEAEQSQN